MLLATAARDAAGHTRGARTSAADCTGAAARCATGCAVPTYPRCSACRPIRYRMAEGERGGRSISQLAVGQPGGVAASEAAAQRRRAAPRRESDRRHAAHRRRAAHRHAARDVMLTTVMPLRSRYRGGSASVGLCGGVRAVAGGGSTSSIAAVAAGGMPGAATEGHCPFAGQRVRAAESEGAQSRYEGRR